MAILQLRSCCQDGLAYVASNTIKNVDRIVQIPLISGSFHFMRGYLQLLSCCQDGQTFVAIWCHDHFRTKKGSVLEHHFIILLMTTLLQTPERDRQTNTRRL